MYSLVIVFLLVVVSVPVARGGGYGLPSAPCCGGLDARFKALANDSSDLVSLPSQIESQFPAGLKDFDFNYFIDRRRQYVQVSLFFPDGAQSVFPNHAPTDPVVFHDPYVHIEPPLPTDRLQTSRTLRFNLPAIFEEAACEYTCSAFHHLSVIPQRPYVASELRSGMLDGTTFAIRINNSPFSNTRISVSCATSLTDKCLIPA